VHVGVGIQNDVLQFAKSEDIFFTEYQITVAIRESGEGATILTETWSESSSETDFNITNSRSEIQYHTYKLSDIYPRGEKKLKPGKYECLIEVRDLISKKSYRNKRVFTVNERSGEGFPQKPSAIVFLYSENPDDHLFPLVPSGSVLGFNGAYQAYSQFPLKKPDSVQINVRVYEVSREGSKLIHQNYVSTRPDSNLLHFYYQLPENLLEEGPFKIRFTARADSLRFDQEKKFRVIWFEKPVYLYKADLAIRPLRYVLPEEEYNDLRGKKYSEMESWLEDFWKEKDPDPRTAYNELLFEFYDRVDKANRQYSTRFKEGWETDQGKVLILYGQPDRVENKRHAANTVPYIIWQYDNGDRIFTFTDADEDGEFSLQTIENGKE
jgi:GWxTD domain-containing protein